LWRRRHGSSLAPETGAADADAPTITSKRGEDGWLKALRLEDYAARRPRRPPALQQALFPYHEAWG
jgi:hypothetical protein